VETALLRTELVTEEVVLQWLSQFKGKKGTTPSRSVFGTAQSALGNLFRLHGVKMPEHIMSGVGDVKKGAQRQRAQEKVEGRVPIEEGKAAIPGYLYLELVEALLKSGTDMFCHTFAVCAWVLMCRVSNVAELRGAHFQWENDSIVISLVKHKADQGGERTDPKHCYANPFKPYACVVTSLGVYFATYGPPRTVRDKVFEGDRQHDRFVEAVRRVLSNNQHLKEQLERLGIKVEDIAAHSFTKGGRSYAQGGTTGGLSTPSILLRGLWALEGMDKRYVRMEAAADQYIGRILAMLDICSPDFAGLCPHFGVVDDAVLDAVRQCFPGAPRELESVLLNCLACLVYRRAYLRANLPAEHPLFRSVVFSQGFADSLAARVDVTFPHDKITPSGIPPHVSIQRSQRELKETMQEMPGLIRQAIKDEFEQRAVDSGSITRDTMQEMMNTMVERVEAKLNPPPPPQQQPPPAPVAAAAMFQMWNVGGVMRRVPEDFKLDTHLPARTLFQLYCLGDQNLRIGPYRKLESKDFVAEASRKRLSDMLSLMRPVEAALKRQNRWERQPTLEQVNGMWDAAGDVIGVVARTNKDRTRRVRQMAWTTQLREYRKRGREEPADDNDDK
jgi:hypothetical protein